MKKVHIYLVAVLISNLNLHYYFSNVICFMYHLEVTSFAVIVQYSVQSDSFSSLPATIQCVNNNGEKNICLVDSF